MSLLVPVSATLLGTNAQAATSQVCLPPKVLGVEWGEWVHGAGMAKKGRSCLLPGGLVITRGTRWAWTSTAGLPLC